MANVLGELFQDIADAIRGKTGETGKIKPINFPSAIQGIEAGSDITLIDNIDITPDFSNGNQLVVASEGYAVKGATILKPETLIPENIADGVEIAGIIGSLIAGTGGSGSALQFANGSFNTGTTGVERVTITHGKNVMPDFIAVWKTGVATMDASTRPFMSAWGMKSKFASGPQAAVCCAGYALAENDNGIDKATESQQNSGYIFCPNETTFQVGRVDSGNGQCLFVPNSAYNWIAIYGIGSGSASGGGVPEDFATVTFMNGAEEHFSRPVYIGDDCPDPVMQNRCDEPTQASTVQYDYAFSDSWSAEPNGEADANILKNITDDKTVYAVYDATVREYTITYLDSDGVTVLNTEQLPYGTVPSYVPTSSSGIFQEWFPAPTAVTGNASYKAVWSAAIVVVPQITITVRTDGTSGAGSAGSATEGFVWGAKYRLTIEGETSEWVATQYYTTFADGNKFTTSGIGNPWARTNRNGSAVTAHRLNSHTGQTVSDTGEKFFVTISGPTTSGQYTVSLYAKQAGTYTFSVVRIPD
jgi:hypothetical protein